MKSIPFPLLIPGDLRREVIAAARITHSKQSHVMRQSIHFGIPLFIQSQVRKDPVSLGRSLPRGVLSKIYRLERKSKTERAAVRAQARPDFDA